MNSSGDKKADLNSRLQRPVNITPLMLAAQHGRESVVKLLIELQADINLVDSTEETARDKAENRGRTNICDLLS